MNRLDSSVDIDIASSREIVRIIQAEDGKVADAVAQAAEAIAAAIDAISERLREGGRMFYVGAGTSGRIATLDAAELPPTFGVDRDLVNVLMAGGSSAMDRAVEGAEDDESEAARIIRERVRPADCVVGVAASGTTPYTVAAVREARRIGAVTIGITSIADSPLSKEVDVSIVTEVGPEVIMGSSRMKSGTAQKLVLNTLSTGVMIRLGRVHSNLMVDMPATNRKLKARAIEMVRIAAGVDEEKASRSLEACGDVREAIVMARRDVTAEEARRILQAHGRDLRKVLAE